MTDSLDRSFGLVIAFLLPGFLCILGVQAISPTVASWLSQEPSTSPTLGGFSYVVLCSLAAGLVASALRWLIVDRCLHQLGVNCRPLDFSRLQPNLQAFELAVHHNYRHYQFYANSLVSLWAFAGCHLAAGIPWSPLVWVGFVALQGVMIVTGRDCLKRYYDRIGEILG